MTDRVVKGTYADFKVIRSRKVVQMIIEVPIEQANDLTTKFGIPDPSMDKWVAVAYLKDNHINPTHDNTDMVKTAGILCKTPKFAEFINFKFNAKIDVHDADAVANVVRSVCGIGSRSSLATNPMARKSFEDLHREYRRWLEKV